MRWKILFSCEMRLNPCEVRLKQTCENLETRKNSNFFSGWREPLVMIFGGVGVGSPDWGGCSGAGGAMAGSQMGQGVGARSARWQGREGMARGRKT